jgi:Zn-dependent protease
LLFALGQPVTFAGLLLAFVLALVLRALAIRTVARRLRMADGPITPSLREDVDPFGAVAAAVGGAGWGRVVDVDEVPRGFGRGRTAWIFLAGPLVTLVASQLVFLAYALLYPASFQLAVYRVSDVLRGRFDAPPAAQFVLALAVGLLAFGLLALIPVPPLDGFGLLWTAHRHPGRGLQGYRLWFEHKNLGVVVLLACCFFPLSSPFLLLPLDLIGTVVLRLWA